MAQGWRTVGLQTSGSQAAFRFRVTRVLLAPGRAPVFVHGPTRKEEEMSRVKGGFQKMPRDTGVFSTGQDWDT